MISYLSLLLGLALAVLPDGAHANLLVNPGFEEGIKDHPWMPAGWDTSRAELQTVFFGRDTFAAHGGRYAISVASASALYPMAHNWSQMLIVDQEWWGKDLVFSVWTRSVGVEGRAYIKLDAYQDTLSKMARIWKVTRDDAAERLHIKAISDPIIDLAWKREFFTEPETDWVRREVRVYLPPTTNVIFVRCGVIGTGQLLLDDASLTLDAPLPAPGLALKSNLLVDPGFEGDGGDWEYSLPPYPDMRAERDSTVAHSGRHSLRMTSPRSAMVQGKTGVCQVVCNRNLGGKRLRFSGYIKTDSLKSSTFLKLHCHSITGERQAVSTEIITGTTDWVPTSVEIDAPLDTYSIWAWFMYIAPTPGKVYFDDARLEVVEAGGAVGGPVEGSGAPKKKSDSKE